MRVNTSGDQEMGDTPPTRGVWVWPHVKTTPSTRGRKKAQASCRKGSQIERVARSSAEVNEYKQQTMADERGDASGSRSSEDRPRPQGHPPTTAAPSVESINHLARALTGQLEGALSASMEGLWERLDARLASLTPGPGLRGDDLRGPLPATAAGSARETPPTVAPILAQHRHGRGQKEKRQRGQVAEDHQGQGEALMEILVRVRMVGRLFFQGPPGMTTTAVLSFNVVQSRFWVGGQQGGDGGWEGIVGWGEAGKCSMGFPSWRPCP